MHRGGSGRASPADPLRAGAAVADATAAAEIAVAAQTFPYGAPYPYSHQDPTTHVYGTYLDYAQHSAAMQAGPPSSVPPFPPPPPPRPADGGPRYETQQVLPHVHEQAIPEFRHDRHHGTVFASVESARWASESDLSTSSLHQYGGVDPYPSSTAYYYATPDQSQPSMDVSLNRGPHVSLPRGGHSSGLVADETADVEPSAYGQDDPTVAEIKPFVYKVFSMLADPDRYQDVILWDHSGEAFFVAHNDRFVSEVLREQFQHSNIHSFTRQLNVYQFQRYTVAQLRSALDLSGTVASTYSGWTHPNFRRGRPDLLHHLNPRPSRARLIRKLEKQYSHPRVPTSSTSTSTHSASFTSSHPGGRRTSSAGGSSSHSSTQTGSDSTRSPPTCSQFLALPRVESAYDHERSTAPLQPPRVAPDLMYLSESQRQLG